MTEPIAIRKLVYIPKLAAGRRTFLLFYSNLRAWSLRDYSRRHQPPTVEYSRDYPYTDDQILRLAEEPGSFCQDAPRHSMEDIDFWHQLIVEANEKYLHTDRPGASAQVWACMIAGVDITLPWKPTIRSLNASTRLFLVRRSASVGRRRNGWCGQVTLSMSTGARMSYASGGSGS